MTDARGYSLIETMMAGAVWLAMTAMAVPFLGGRLERERAIIGAQYLAGTLQRARLESLKRARSVALRLELTGERAGIQLFVDGDGDGVRQRDIDSGIDPPLAPLEYLDDRARDVSLRINQVITDAGGTSALGPGDDPIRIGATALLTFTPLGGATSGTLYVAARHGPQMAIRVFGGTGRVRVLMFDARARQWQH